MTAAETLALVFSTGIGRAGMRRGLEPTALQALIAWPLHPGVGPLVGQEQIASICIAAAK